MPPGPTFHRLRPPAPLDDLVEWLWFFDEPCGRGLERRLPDGGLEIVLHLEGEGTHAAGVREPAFVVAGPRARPELLDASPGRLVGVHCRPGSARSLLGVPGRAVCGGLDLDLRDIWGACAAELAERVAEAKDPAGQLEALAGGLLAAVWRNGAPRSRRDLVGAALRTIEGDPARARVGDLVDRAGVSWRVFTETFEEEVGLTPKLYQRVRRLQGAVRELYRKPDAGLADVALGAGFADQAHLVREFRALGDVTPARYHRTAPETRNHVPVATDAEGRKPSRRAGRAGVTINP